MHNLKDAVLDTKKTTKDKSKTKLINGNGRMANFS